MNLNQGSQLWKTLRASTLMRTSFSGFPSVSALNWNRTLLPNQLNCVISIRTVWGNEHRPNPRGKNRPNKHKDPWLGKFRAGKVLKIDLPDYDFQRSIENQELSPSEVKEYMKLKGILPMAPYQERSTYISCTAQIQEQFVPPEGDGKASVVSKKGASQSVTGVTTKGKTFLATRKIRQFEDTFDPREFAHQAQDIYIKAHQALAWRDEDELHKYATEKAYPEMMLNMERKSIEWSFIKSLEPPRVVQVRTMDVLSKANLYGQVTVRFNTQQTLGVYDRFGRLIHGNPDVAKDVLEYVVFEKHLANVYGTWRIHGKIIPDWIGDKEGSRITNVLRTETQSECEDTTDTKEVSEDKRDSQDTEEEKEVVYDRFGKQVKE